MRAHKHMCTHVCRTCAHMHTCIHSGAAAWGREIISHSAAEVTEAIKIDEDAFDLYCATSGGCGCKTGKKHARCSTNMCCKCCKLKVRCTLRCQYKCVHKCLYMCLDTCLGACLYICLTHMSIHMLGVHARASAATHTMGSCLH